MARDQLEKANERAHARVTQETALRVAADEAFAQQLTTVETSLDAAEQDISANAQAISSLQTSVSIQGNQITANSQAITAAQADIADLENDVSGNASAISSLSATVTAQGGQISANADAISVVEATTNYGTAQGLMGWSAVSAPGGVAARFQLAGRVTTGGGNVFAGMWLDLLSGGGSRLLMKVDEFLLTNGAVNGTPFRYVNSILQLAVAHIGTVEAGIVRSADGKVNFDLSNSRLVMADNS